jgi:ribonuclease HI
MPSDSPRNAATQPVFPQREVSRDKAPDHYLVAHSDGGARGNPGPAGYGVVIQDQSGRQVAALSEYLGHQTNNFAEYQGLIGALEYALEHGPKALKLISDSELLVRQIKGIYKVKNPTLRDLHARAQELIAQLDWFSIGHALREHNQEADRLANEAMDKGMGRVGADRVARTLLPANPCGRGRLGHAIFTPGSPGIRRHHPQRRRGVDERQTSRRDASSSPGEEGSVAKLQRRKRWAAQNHSAADV